jgi:hypothetical protein
MYVYVRGEQSCMCMLGVSSHVCVAFWNINSIRGSGWYITIKVWTIYNGKITYFVIEFDHWCQIWGLSYHEIRQRKLFLLFPSSQVLRKVWIINWQNIINIPKCEIKYELTHFVGQDRKVKKYFTENEVTSILEFIINNIFVEFGGHKSSATPLEHLVFVDSFLSSS